MAKDREPAGRHTAANSLEAWEAASQLKPGEIDPRVTELLAASISDVSPRGIAAGVNRLVRSGRLKTGDRLPTVRGLAKRLGVSPATVSEAWQALSRAGTIESHGRSGTLIRSSSEPSRPVRYLGVGVAPVSSTMDLSTSMPDPLLLPLTAKALHALDEPELVWTTSYLDDPVLPQLEALLRDAWPFEPERLVVVDGALDALARVAAQLVQIGDRVVMENPGFPALIDLLDACGAEIIPVEVDEEGVVPQDLAEALTADPVAVFLQPRAQNPTGASVSELRVRQLAKVLARHRATWIVEADHSGEIARAPDLSIGSQLPERTIRVRSYSKSHGPDLRIAALSGPAEVIDPIMARRMLGPGWTSRILQAILVQMLTDPAADRKVAAARTAYEHRCGALRAALRERDVPCTAGDGVNVWVDVVDERSAMLTLAAMGIRVAPGGPFLIRPTGSDHLRVTAGLLPDDVESIAHVAEQIAVAANVRPTARGGVS